MSSEPLIGECIAGRYELRDRLGACGPRVAYRAFDREVEVEIALWWIRPSLMPNAEAQRSFFASVSALQAIRHRHLLRVFDAGIASGLWGQTVYVTQQLGTSCELEARLDSREPAAGGFVLAYGQALAEAIEACHVNGIHHGWLLPADVVEVAGQVKLSGIGLLAGMDTSAALTLWGRDCIYVAPEVLAGEASTASSDWYSLAMMLLKLTLGKAMVEPAKKALALLPREQRGALQTSLSSQPGQRPTSGAEFVSSLHLGWHDPHAMTFDEDLPTVIDEAETAISVLAISMAEPAIVLGDVEPEIDSPVSLMVSEVTESTSAIPGPMRTHLDSPSAKLHGISMKPTSEGELDTVRAEAVRPVLRPLASLRDPSLALQSLGTLAPPQEPRSSHARFYGILLSLALVGGAAVVSLVLLLTTSEKRVPAVDQVPTEPTTSEPPMRPALLPLPQKVVVIGASCPEDMTFVKVLSLCIETFEAPGQGRRPQSGLTLLEAREECGTRKRRLCSTQEWQRACSETGQAWPYGDNFQAEICNVRTGTIETVGTSTACISAFGVLGMSGNVAEWVEEGEILGGSAQDRSKGRCTQSRQRPARQPAYSDVGFRCCADAIASAPSSD